MKVTGFAVRSGILVGKSRGILLDRIATFFFMARIRPIPYSA